MPCTKCEEGKYKWGETGKCEYATKEDCESANHKYSKMRPTPLGKKTYEEYAKELKEYNLSSAQRFQFNDIKTLDKLSSQVYTIYDAMPDRNEIEVPIINIEEYQDDIYRAEQDLESAKEVAEDAQREVDFYEEEAKGILPRIKEEKNNVKEANQEIKLRTSEIKTATKGKADATKKASAIIKTANTQVNKAKKLHSSLEKAINEFEKAAKALGVNVSGKISEYDTALKDIDEVAGFKVPKLK